MNYKYEDTLQVSLHSMHAQAYMLIRPLYIYTNLFRNYIYQILCGVI